VNDEGRGKEKEGRGRNGEGFDWGPTLALPFFPPSLRLGVKGERKVRPQSKSLKKALRHSHYL